MAAGRGATVRRRFVYFVWKFTTEIYEGDASEWLCGPMANGLLLVAAGLEALGLHDDLLQLRH